MIVWVLTVVYDGVIENEECKVFAKQEDGMKAFDALRREWMDLDEDEPVDENDWDDVMSESSNHAMLEDKEVL